MRFARDSMVGFRNIAVHAYATLDDAIVHRIVDEHLGGFRRFGRRIAEVTSDGDLRRQEE